MAQAKSIGFGFWVLVLTLAPEWAENLSQRSENPFARENLFSEVALGSDEREAERFSQCLRRLSDKSSAK